MLKAAIIGFYNLNESPWETTKKLSGWGYRAYEAGNFLLKGNPDENLKKLSEYDFKVLSTNADLNRLKNNIGEIASEADRLKVKYVCCYWSDPQNYGEASEIAEILDTAGSHLREAGLALCYHNHDHEFKKSFNGVKYFDILMSQTSPENLCVNLDAGWAAVGGENVPELIKRLCGRIKLMHFKDFYDLNDRSSFTALGTGKVDIAGIAAQADKAGLEYITVEQDSLRNLSRDDSVMLSYLTLKESGFVQ